MRSNALNRHIGACKVAFCCPDFASLQQLLKFAARLRSHCCCCCGSWASALFPALLQFSAIERAESSRCRCTCQFGACVMSIVVCLPPTLVVNYPYFCIIVMTADVVVVAIIAVIVAWILHWRRIIFSSDHFTAIVACGTNQRGSKSSRKMPPAGR